MTNPFTQPDYSAQSGDAYKALIDAAIEIVNKTAGSFNPHAQTVPDMTLRLDAGTVYNPITRARSDVAAQSTGTITAPSANPRKDIVCVGILTGTVSVITGAEAGSPTDPAITADLIPIARITLQTSTTTITDAITDDIRELGNLGLEASKIPLLNLANTFTKTQTWTKGTDVATATIVTLGDGNLFDLTGAVTVAGFTTKGVGTTIKIHLDGAPLLTHHATDFILPGGADIQGVAGDEFEMYEYATGDWRVAPYQVATSAPGAGGTGWEFVSYVAFSGVSAVDTTDLEAGYDYKFAVRNVVGSASGAFRARISINNGSSFLSSTQYKVNDGTKQTQWALIDDLNTAAADACDVETMLFNPYGENRNIGGSNFGSGIRSDGSGSSNADIIQYDAPGGTVNAMRFYPSTGTISGTISVFRRKLTT